MIAMTGGNMDVNSQRIRRSHASFALFHTRFLGALLLLLLYNSIIPLSDNVDGDSRRSVVLYRPYTAPYQRISSGLTSSRSRHLLPFTGGIGLVAMAEDTPSETMNSQSASEGAAALGETMETPTSTSGRSGNSDDMQPLSADTSSAPSPEGSPSQPPLAQSQSVGRGGVQYETSSTSEVTLASSTCPETGSVPELATATDAATAGSETVTEATPTATESPSSTYSAESSSAEVWEHEPAEKPSPKPDEEDDDEEADQGLRELPKLSLKEYKAQLKQQQREAELNSLLDVNNVQGNPPEAPVNIVAEEEMTDSETDDSSKPDFASQAAGAVILAKNPEAKGAKNLLVDDKDAYCMSPCDKSKFVVIGLSEDVLVDTVVLANYERYSSSIKDFLVLGSQRYPTNEWILLGNFTAEDVYGEQTFSVSSNPWTRYIKLVWLSHYGNEFYCTLTSLQVHGSTIMEDFRAEMQKSEDEDKISQAEEERLLKRSTETPAPSTTVDPASRRGSDVVYESREQPRYRVSSTTALPGIHSSSSTADAQPSFEAGVALGDRIELQCGDEVDDSRREQAVKLPSNYVVFAALNLSEATNDSEILDDEDVRMLPSHEQPVEYTSGDGMLVEEASAARQPSDSNTNALSSAVGWLHYIRGLNGLCFFTHDKRRILEAESRCMLMHIPPYNCVGKARVVQPRRDSMSVLKEVKFNTSTSQFANTFHEAFSASYRKCPLPGHLPLVGYSWHKMINGVCRTTPTRYFEGMPKSMLCCPPAPTNAPAGESSTDTSPVRCCSDTERDWCCGVYSSIGSNASVTVPREEQHHLNESMRDYAGHDFLLFGENTSASSLENFSDPNLSDAGSVLDSGSTLEGGRLADVLTGDSLQESLKGGKPASVMNIKATPGSSIFKMLTSRLKELAMEQQIMDEYLDNWQKQYEKIIQNYGTRLDKHRLQLQNSKANYSAVKESVEMLERNMQGLLKRIDAVEQSTVDAGFVSPTFIDTQLGRYLAIAAFLFSIACAAVCAYVVYLAKRYWEAQRQTMERYLIEIKKMHQEFGYQLEPECNHVSSETSVNGESSLTIQSASTKEKPTGTATSTVSHRKECASTVVYEGNSRCSGRHESFDKTPTKSDKPVVDRTVDTAQSGVPADPIVGANYNGGGVERLKTSPGMNGISKREQKQNR
eukprot:gb/GECG01002740.1/.p1 GENE.gb/GECG01002740.1/~~gb/GECG01002740.1/.p1  ORF type:complete len:1170 (+),score=154.16 gb/GECG01002740.1/:1-3510(+)